MNTTQPAETIPSHNASHVIQDRYIEVVESKGIQQQLLLIEGSPVKCLEKSQSKPKAKNLARPKYIKALFTGRHIHKQRNKKLLTVNPA